LRRHRLFASVLVGLLLPILPVNSVDSVDAQAPAPRVNPVPVLAGIPGPLTWQNPPVVWKIENEKLLSITAGKGTG
jgi:hypothetical protein